MKKFTEARLEKEVWWWRLGADHHSEYFKESDSLAFHYELVRRIHRRKRFAPFHALKAPYLFLISELADETFNEMASRDAGDPDKQNEKGWTQPRPLLQWNLKLSDRALQKAFLKYFIQQERQLQAMPSPRPNAGKRNRGFSWRWVELMDLHDLKVRPLNDAERSKLSEARKRGNYQAKIFMKAVERFRKEKLASRPILPDSWFVRWVQLFEHFTSPEQLWRGVWPRE